MRREWEIGRPLKPWRSMAPPWFGGRVVSIDEQAQTCVITVPRMREFTVAIAAFTPPHAPTLNGAVICRFANYGETTAIDDLLIAAVRGARFLGLREHSEEYPNVGHVPYNESLPGLANEDPFYDWTPGV